MEKEEIANLARLAAVLEVSTEKPGNVTPTHNFSDTTYEDFLAGSIAIGSAVGGAAIAGYRAGRGEIPVSDMGIGKFILDAILDVKKSHSGGNTHLGTVMLMIPIASAVGMCIWGGNLNFGTIRENIKKIVGESTIADSKNLYRAIKKSGAGGIGKLLEKEVPFHELMEISAGRDGISRELAGGMGIIFDVGIPNIEKFYNETGDIRRAILEVYLLILSKYPDTFITKKAGIENAKEVSRKAGMVTRGELSIGEFDRGLRACGDGNPLNPGTTADLVCGVLMLWLIGNTTFSAPGPEHHPFEHQPGDDKKNPK